MKYIDMHCDTILSLLENPSISLMENNLHVDLKKLRTGETLVQNFALFTDQKALDIPEHQTMRLMDVFWTQMETYSDWIRPVLRFEDIVHNEKAGKISALLTLEDGGVVFNDLAMLRNYYRMGVRMIALTWNYPNGIGYPNFSMNDFDDYKQASPLQQVDTVHGLTPFGIQYIQEMERLGIIVDVSHLNDAGFYDVLRYTSKPFVASHSNARAVCDVARNLSDDMIVQLDRRGGVMGINFCGDFLEKSDVPNGPSRIEAMVKHICHIRDVASIHCIGIGTDFDGIHSPMEIQHAGQMEKLADALKNEGFSKKEIEQIFYKNVLRVYQNVLK